MELVDLSYLERQPDTFVDAQHRMLEVDVLFKTRCKGTHQDSYIWVLIEQQREPDVWLPLRQFCYIGVIWDHIRKSSKSRAASNKLPFIYPLIISNASKPYRHSLTLRDMIEPEEAKPLFDELFSKPSQLIDLAAIPDEELRIKLQRHVQAQALLLSLKHVFDDDLQKVLEAILLPSFKALDKMGHGDDLADMLYYLYNEGNLADSNQFWPLLHRQFSHGVEEKVMTLGQQAVQQAVKSELQASVLRMLEKKCDIQFIVEVTKLSKEEVMLLAKKNNH